MAMRVLEIEMLERQCTHGSDHAGGGDAIAGG